MFIKSVYVEPNTSDNQYMLKRYGYTTNEFTNPSFIHFLSEYYKKSDGKTYYFNGGTTSVYEMFDFLIQHIRNNSRLFDHNIPDDIFLKPKRKRRKKKESKSIIDINREDLYT